MGLTGWFRGPPGEPFCWSESSWIAPLGHTLHPCKIYFLRPEYLGHRKPPTLLLEANFPLADTVEQNVLIPMMGDQPSINNAGCSNVPGMKYSELLMRFGLNSHRGFRPNQW